MSYKKKYEVLIQYIESNTELKKNLREFRGNESNIEDYQKAYYNLLDDFQNFTKIGNNKDFILGKGRPTNTSKEELTEELTEEQLARLKDLIFIRMTKYLSSFEDHEITRIQQAFIKNEMQIEEALSLLAARSYELLSSTKKNIKHHLRSALAAYAFEKTTITGVDISIARVTSSTLKFDDYIYCFMASKKPGNILAFYTSLKNLESIFQDTGLSEDRFIKEIIVYYKEHIDNQDKCKDTAAFVDELNAFGKDVSRLKKDWTFRKNFKGSEKIILDDDTVIDAPPSKEVLREQAQKIQSIAGDLQEKAIALFGGEKKGSRGYKILGKALSIIGALAVVVGAVLSFTGVGVIIGAPIAGGGASLAAAGSAILFKHRDRTPAITKHAIEKILSVDQTLKKVSHDLHQSDRSNVRTPDEPKRKPRF